MQWRGSLAALFIAMGCVSKKEMTVDLNRLILGKSYNSTKVFRTAQHVVQAILLGIVVPLLILLLIWDLTDNPNPVPAVVVIAGLVMLCFFFSYVFVVPDDLTSSATDRTLAIASKIFAYTSRGLTPEAALGASKIILSETIASAICFTDGKQVLASWGEDSAKCPAGTPVVLRTTLNVINSGEQSVFSRDASTETGGYFPRLRAGIVAPLTVRGHCVGTLELYYPRLSSVDMRQTALASGFADLISTQLASFELERQDELTARVELRALQSQVDPHFLFNTISTIVSLVRTEPDKARSLLIDFSNYYRQTLSDSDTLTTLEHEVEQGTRYINLMQARYGDGRLRVSVDIDFEVRDSMVPPFILQPLLENCIKHAQRETEPLSIRVRAFETDDGLEIIVEDDGIGMSEEFQKKLFDEFAQEENGVRTQYKGTGLGMPISKKYIELMGGTITVDSRKGVGTTFTVEIPMELTNAEKVEKTKPLVQHNDLKGIKVLLAEDNDLNAELATILLEDLGMTVTRAADGQEVVDLFAEYPAGTYDIILMDIMMPKMDGHQAAKAIRAMYADRPDAEEIPIIALSANAFSEDVQASQDAGMNGHVSKPLNMEEVTKVIERNLNRP